jgi:hypothetical protein
MKNWKNIFNIEININKARDAAIAMVLVLLLLELFVGNRIFLKIAIPVLVINMIVPQIFYPLGYFWFGLAHLLGTITSKILLFFVYILVVLPVGLLRRATGKDILYLKKWKQGSSSTFKTRNHLFTASDIEKPY